MLSHVGLAILHGCIAAAFVEGLLRIWRVTTPAHRLALRAVALAAPFVLPPVFAYVAPFRHDAAFATRWAIFAGAHWDTLTVGGVGAASLATGVLAAVGVVFFLRDAGPFLTDRIRADRQDPPLGASHPARARLHAVSLRAVALAATARTGGPAPSAPAAPGGVDFALRLTAAAQPVLYCSGTTAPVVTVSLGTLDRLDDDELVAALAHELAHIHRRDPALGWLLMAVRVIQAFNPATQVVGRQIVQEIESRADWDVAERGAGPALARAIARISTSEPVRSDLAESSAPAMLASLIHRAVSNAALERCERLFVPKRADVPGTNTWYIALASMGLAVVLFFVV